MIAKIRFIRAFAFVAFSICFSITSVRAEDFYVELSSDSRVHLSEPLTAVSRKLFEPGWGVAEFLGPQGKKIRLFTDEHFTSTGGVIFSPPEYWKISPSGKFAVLVILRAGLLGDPQDKKVTSRQYCPVLNTTSGCLESVQSGEICAGEWDKKRDIWSVIGENENSTSIMLGTQFGNKSATEVWDDFSNKKLLLTNINLQERLEDNLGVTNLMACDPIQNKNRAIYQLIADQLHEEGDRADATYIMKRLDSSHNEGTEKKWQVAVDKSWLYGSANVSSRTSMYLIRGDLVRVTSSHEGDWLLVEYEKSDGSRLIKWMRSKDLILR
jgi:hypothetical protein